MRKRQTRGPRPPIIEMVGPAGAGKTTLAVSLSDHGSRMRMLGIPRLRGLRNFPGLFRNFVPLLPILRLQWRNDRPLTWRETKMMIHVTGRHAIPKRLDPNEYSAIILDHGPIYMLTALDAFGPAVTQTEAFRRWWAKRLAEWASYLDVVVWLDAPDSVLAERIDDRDHPHVIRGIPRQEMFDFLSRYRSAFESVMSAATALNSDLEVFRFRTDTHSTAQMTDELLAAFQIRLDHPVPK